MIRSGAPLAMILAMLIVRRMAQSLIVRPVSLIGRGPPVMRTLNCCGRLPVGAGGRRLYEDG